MLFFLFSVFFLFFVLFQALLLFLQQSILPLLVQVHYQVPLRKLLFHIFFEVFPRSNFFGFLKIEPAATADTEKNAVLYFLCRFLVPYFLLLFYRNFFWQI